MTLQLYSSTLKYTTRCLPAVFSQHTGWIRRVWDRSCTNTFQFSSSSFPDKSFREDHNKVGAKDRGSGHFCCWQCDESLTGQRYVLRDDHPYCIKCYESVFANSCEDCSKIIGIDSKVILLFGLRIEISHRCHPSSRKLWSLQIMTMNVVAGRVQLWSGKT